jgi:hypothetical protein
MLAARYAQVSKEHFPDPWYRQPRQLRKALAAGNTSPPPAEWQPRVGAGGGSGACPAEPEETGGR